MSTPPSIQPSNSGYFGPLIGEYGVSLNYLLLVPVGVLCLLFGLFGLFGGDAYTTTSRFFVVAIGIICFGAFYLTRGTRAQLFERGFIISRRGKTVSGRWEDIATMEHQIWRSYLFGFIPMPWRSHHYKIILKSGERVKIDPYFRKAEEVGNTIQRMWRKAGVNAVHVSSEQPRQSSAVRPVANGDASNFRHDVESQISPQMRKRLELAFTDSPLRAWFKVDGAWGWFEARDMDPSLGTARQWVVTTPKGQKVTITPGEGALLASIGLAN